MADGTNPLFKIRLGETVHVVDRLTLGDWRMLKTEFGLSASDIFTEFPNAEGEMVQAISADDPNVLVGLMVISLRHERPKAPIKLLIAEVENFGIDEWEFIADDPEPEADAAPLDDGADEDTDSQPRSGKSGKRQKTPGPRS